jgi:hypothetical protein
VVGYYDRILALNPVVKKSRWPSRARASNSA